MQREIEALLLAYSDDRNRETQMLQNLLSALAVGAAARQRMVRDLCSVVLAIEAHGAITAAASADPSADGKANDITSAVASLRPPRAPSRFQ